MNDLIERILANFAVPVSFLYYDGDAPAYVTYQQTDADEVLSADDKLQALVEFYDFDIYSTGNYNAIIESLKTALTDAGFLWQPSRSSGDMYDRETKLFHKTLCFAIERSV